MGVRQPKFVVFTDFDHSATTLSASTEAGDLVVENLQTQRRGQKWRTTALNTWGGVAEGIIIDFGAAVPINCVFGIGHNMDDTGNGDIQVEYAAADAWPGTEILAATNAIVNPFSGSGWNNRGWTAATAINHANISEFRPEIFHMFAGTVSARYWRIRLLDTGRTDGVTYLEFGRLGVGNTWTPPCLYDWGSTHSIHDPTQVEYTLGQNPVSVQLLTSDVWQINFTRVSPSQYHNYFRTLFRLVGLGNDFLYVHDSQSGREAWTDQFIIYGRLVEMPTYNEQLVGGTLSMKMRRSR